MLLNLYFSNGAPPVKVTPANFEDWAADDETAAAVSELAPRQRYTDANNDTWERIR